jgi:GMP synthase (glutamine-hydrolysing)
MGARYLMHVKIFLLMFKPERFIDEKIAWLGRAIGGGEALAATSGGVDSMTTAALGHKAVGDRLKVVFLDDGLMRKGEPQKVVGILKRLGIKARIYDVKDYFFEALKGKTDPEEKRKAFREAFYQTFARIARELGINCLLQGTIAADVVETKGGVKSQHNVLEQIGISPLDRYGYKVLEPLKDIYKPQVREVAQALGLPREVAERRPFPGPGLSIRILGEVTPERVELVREATAIVEDETEDVPCFQAFAVLMQDRATGVAKTGKRKYGEIVVVRVVQSKDAMTAEPTALPWKILRRIEKRVAEAIPTVTHVLLDLSGKPPATIEFE